MAKIKVRADESIDDALRRFKKNIQRSGILSDIKRRDHYEKPSAVRKRKLEAAKRKQKKKNRFNRFK